MQQFKKVAFYTLGCKLNFSETSTISRLFENAGFAKVEFEETPDILVINTCSVTENADKKCKQLVRRAKKINPEVYVAIIGCYAQLKPTEIAQIPGVSLVLGANEKFNIVEHLEAVENEKQSENEAVVKFENIKQTKSFIPSYSIGDRTRSFLKVQDGCDYFCTFCTIPLARGKSRNAGITETVREAQKIADTKIKEVVLTGVNIGDFGQGSDENFFELVKALDEVNGIDRYRISSIEPNLLSDEIIQFTLENSKRFVPHFHIPLQSGSNRLLKAMRRKYLRELYAERVKYIKKLRPDCAIGVDVIVGFPGETDEEFLETVGFLKDLDVSYLHVFTYSERANTTAIKLGDPIPNQIRAQRSRHLHILSDKKKRAFYDSQIGSQRTVLFEAEEDEGMMYGFTENYVKVKTPYNADLINQMQKVQLTEIDRDGVLKCEFI
ncbi:tRNA (N(6)-L-threonylcarbamoyladenosine(37)-C(2))-methylthiotransferase MtaB [Fluviicola sp.]|jgi:threonylcarbamoyladenosine tRNA methylthiotransferase MtaB|uniref:tRNA (N(6)-L-threonylcarbamoyladenosine(37)-C(2))- methylthiotransferase MtaB n=1 Tax=Fluviicola sp. TaxID=1917219 RepID=UPI00282FB392|nr:tRNA (N(6)-L-threonylcarbamoyladenosine(37)-C(2))-methylthiotransferase MtaB [Fluviicola sp.]MDR0802266.1 tRNA (N(6)-L-threonylcarbamoyladenosine(37)-C(2))-methylthiotransferase MtaB [Fluviicola sp.]